MTDLGDVTALQNAIEDRLELIDQLNAHGIVPGNIITPAAMVRLVSIDYGDSFDGISQYRFEIVLAVRAVNVEARSVNLNEYLNTRGDRSIQIFVEGDATLGGISETVIVQRAHDIGMIDIAGASYWGAIFDVDVAAV